MAASEVELSAERIREIRTGLGLSQDRFAGRIGVTVHTVRRWEYGWRQPRIGALIQALRQAEIEAFGSSEPEQAYCPKCQGIRQVVAGHCAICHSRQNGKEVG